MGSLGGYNYSRMKAQRIDTWTRKISQSDYLLDERYIVAFEKDAAWRGNGSEVMNLDCQKNVTLTKFSPWLGIFYKDLGCLVYYQVHEFVKALCNSESSE